MNNNPMNGFGMNGRYPQVDGNAMNYGGFNMATGNPTLDLLNQSNGMPSNPGMQVPTNTGNPTLDLLNQSQVQNAQENSYSFVPSMSEDTNNGMGNYQQAPSFGVGTDMGMPSSVPMPPMDYNNGVGQMPMGFQQQGYGMDTYSQTPMQQVDYNTQVTPQPYPSMEVVPLPEVSNVPTLEPSTNPYGFVPLMPTPEPAPVAVEQPQVSTGELNFSFIPLREENTQPTLESPMPQEQMVSPMPPMDYNNGVGQMPMGIQQQGYGMDTYSQTPMQQVDYNTQVTPQPYPSMEVAPVPEPPMMPTMPQEQMIPQVPMDYNNGMGQMPMGIQQPAPVMPQPMEYTQPLPQIDYNTQMPVAQNMEMPQPGYGMNGMPTSPMPPMDYNNGMGQMPMGVPQPVPQDYNMQMNGAPMGYPQPMMQPAQDPNMIYPGIPDDIGNFPR